MDAEVEERLEIDLAAIPPEGGTVEGEVDIIDYEDEFVHPFGGVRYSLFVQPVGSELLVKGRLEQDFDLVCSRCGCDFDTTSKVEDFLQSYEIGEKTQKVDLTTDARASRILNLPTYPVCSEACPGVETKPNGFQDGRWSALDELKK